MTTKIGSGRRSAGKATRRAGIVLAAWLGSWLLQPAAAETTPKLARLAQVGPWPAISALVGYRGRVWFANSVKFEDHNSADIYSFDPRTGRVRYEAQLFSQDAGEPVVHRGLLFWPFEDPRGDTSRAEFMVTDGREWEWGYVPDGVAAFHLHALAEHAGALYGATSAWRAAVHVSRDGGATWRQIHAQDNSPDEISRILAFATFRDRLYAAVTNRDRLSVKLLRLDGQAFRPVPGWPLGRALIGLTPFRGHLYGIQTGPEGRRVWRTDGNTAERVAGLDQQFVRDLTAGPGHLWAITARPQRGALWRSADGETWEKVWDFEAEEPFDVIVYAGAPYVGTLVEDGPASLWGPATPAPDAATAEHPPPLRPPHIPLSEPEARRDLARLDRLLADSDAYAKHGAAILAALKPLAFSGEPSIGQAFSAWLTRDYPRDPIRMYGGQVLMSRDKVARWYLLWGLAVNRNGRVPPDFVSGEWRPADPNPPQKFQERVPGAAWAMRWLGQSDKETIATLVAGLDRAELPLWLKGDLVGALTMLTGERFAYDFTAWRGWAASR